MRLGMGLLLGRGGCYMRKDGIGKRLRLGKAGDILISTRLGACHRPSAEHRLAMQGDSRYFRIFDKLRHYKHLSAGQPGNQSYNWTDIQRADRSTG